MQAWEMIGAFYPLCYIVSVNFMLLQFTLMTFLSCETETDFLKVKHAFWLIVWTEQVNKKYIWDKIGLHKKCKYTLTDSIGGLSSFQVKRYFFKIEREIVFFMGFSEAFLIPENKNGKGVL